MKKNIFSILASLVMIAACTESTKEDPKPGATNSLVGTWKLLTGTIIEKGDTVVTDYTKDRSFIKIINNSHFTFLNHTLRKDTTDFSAGGGRYTLNGNNYTEHLEYCNAKEWEGHDFSFLIVIKEDTLVQSGIEKIEAQSINRINTEKYIRVK